MVKVSTKMDDNAVLEIPVSTNQEDKVEEKADSTSVLLKLRTEEAALVEEKQNWIALRESLQAKVKDEIELRKSNSEKLKSEIANLKVSCEELTKAINEGVLEK